MNVDIKFIIICSISRSEDSNDPTFLCERVCTSDRLLRRMGGLSKVWPSPLCNRFHSRSFFNNSAESACADSGRLEMPDTIKKQELHKSNPREMNILGLTSSSASTA